MAWEKVTEIGGASINVTYDFSKYEYRFYNPNSIRISIYAQRMGSGESWKIKYYVDPKSAYYIPTNMQDDLFFSTEGTFYFERQLLNTAPTTPGAFTSPSGTLKGGASVTASWGASSDAQGNTITYYPEYRYYKNGVAQSWTSLANNTSRSRSMTLTTDNTLNKIEFRVRASDGSLYSGYRNSDVFNIEHNTAPTVTLNTENNKTLYENDTFTIEGSANDTNTGDVVTVRYQINALSPVAILPFVADGAAKSFSRELTFRSGNLYDGETLIASNLAEGVAHKLKVYATDDKNGQSSIIERTFYVVPNRAPSIIVDTVSPSGNIDSDKFAISGTFSDADGNTATVKYRINGGNSVQVAEGVSGTFNFDVSLGSLQVGDNSVVIEVTDSYGAKTSKTVKLRKNAVSTNILKSTVRYKVVPPTGKASELLLWVQRDENLTVEASVSMTMQGEAESYAPMTQGTSVTLDSGQVEDEFYYDAGSEKDAIILQLDLTKSSVDADESITLISGVF